MSGTAGDERPRVALVAMPFLETDRPSLALSLLKAGLAKRGIGSAIHYLNVRFAEQVGLDGLELLDHFLEVDQAKEWIFVEALWGPDRRRDDAFEELVLRGNVGGFKLREPPVALDRLIDEVWSCRRQVARYLEGCLQDIPWADYRLVGFSTVFQQNVPSLALAKELKERYPDLTIVLGGANCEGAMGRTLLKEFPFIDAVCGGEGDHVFPEFVERLLHDGAPQAVAGLLCRGKEPAESSSAAMVTDLDTLPLPDFDDFFEQRNSSPALAEERLLLMLENSRGCWWGEKSHCTFCGLNGALMKFRQKSPQRTVRELRWLVDRYGEWSCEILSADTIISMDYLRAIAPELQRSGAAVVCYETKANLKRSELGLLRQAGVQTIQPGIESLSTRILRLMGKGVTALQNIQLLKWCREVGLHPHWNYLIGFPGEHAQDYEDQADLIRAISHLPPPHAPGLKRVRFDRFSPYQSRPESFGVTDVRPCLAYRYVYPGLDDSAIENLARLFECHYEGQDRFEDYVGGVRSAIDTWLDTADASALFSLQRNGQLAISDCRHGFEPSTILLAGRPRRLYEACTRIRSRQYLLRQSADGTNPDVAERDLDALLKPLLESRLMLEEDGKYLSLALPLESAYFPPEGVWPHLDKILETVNECPPRRPHEEGQI